MRDELDGRLWNDQHEAFTADLARRLRHFWTGFARLQAIAFRAPWQRAARSRGGAGWA